MMEHWSYTMSKNMNLIELFDWCSSKGIVLNISNEWTNKIDVEIWSENGKFWQMEIEHNDEDYEKSIAELVTEYYMEYIYV